jgi:hypothetical protein
MEMQVVVSLVYIFAVFLYDATDGYHKVEWSPFQIQYNAHLTPWEHQSELSELIIIIINIIFCLFVYL